MGCGSEPAPSEDPGAPPEEVAEAPAPDFDEEVYRRSFTFITLEADSVVAVPWFFQARTHPEGVLREIQGWVLRNGAWEPFVEEQRDSPPTRSPWRILPGENTRIIAGNDDGLEALVFQEGGRQLRLGLAGLVTEWSSPQGEAFRIHRGRATILAESMEGLILDVQGGGTGGSPGPGDWAFLVSGDSLQVYLDHPPGREGVPNAGRAWTRLDLVDSHWPDLTVEWTETRPFERARRDVPSRWRFQTPGEDVVGELEAGPSHLEVLEGEGPILPVHGVVQVTGVVRMGDRELPVVGLMRHGQS